MPDIQTTPQLHPVVANYIAFLKSHEKIVAVVLGALLIWHCWGGWIQHQIDKDKLAASQAAQVAAVQAQSNQDKQTALTKQIADLKTAMGQVQANDAVLTQAVAARDAALAKTKAQIASATLPEVITTWQSLVPNVIAADFTPLDQGMTAVSDNAARNTVSALEELSVDRANIKDLNNVVAGKDDIIGKQSDAITSSSTLIDGLHKQIDADQKACQAQITSLQAQQKKKSRSWFLRGLGIGAGIVAFILK